MRTRQDIELWEKKSLAPYAMKSRDSEGRRHPEPVHNIRTCYQRDRDRIVHSEAFRKLEYKTQVFVIIEGDYYRTRLTHTIEVAQIARTIGRSLRLNEDLIEAIALAHDLGHPPFGHSGEEALNDIMSRVGLKFNHNLRSFEIVNHIEKRYPNFDGLNLTNEVLVGILKHQTVYDAGGCLKNFPQGPTLEAKVVDVADSLAYLNHDVDDGLMSGFISEGDLKESRLWKRALESIKDYSTYSPQMRRYQVVKQLIDMQIKDLLKATDQQLKKTAFRSSAAVKKFTAQNPDAVIIGFSPRMAKDRDFLQALLMEKLYYHYRVVRMTSKAKRIINDLFEVYHKDPHQLPYSIYSRTKEFSDVENHEIICNYIASMTDRAAMAEHKKLFDAYTKV